MEKTKEIEMVALLNPIRTGLLRVCKSGEGCFPPAPVKFNPDNLGQRNLAGDSFY